MSINTNLYLIKKGIWRAHYLKDGIDTTIWFASEGEAAFSIWGYADNSYSQISIEVMSDSIAYCISGVSFISVRYRSLALGLPALMSQFSVVNNWCSMSRLPKLANPTDVEYNSFNFAPEIQ